MANVLKVHAHLKWSGLPSSRFVGLPLVDVPRHGEKRRSYSQPQRLEFESFHRDCRR